jgi:hypothetical protein
MSDETKPDLQFDRAEFAQAEPGSALCRACNEPVGSAYYAVNGQVVCERCKTALETQRALGSPVGRFLRAALYGLGGGVLGAGVWYAVRATTGYELGLIAIGVGFLVGAGVRKGSDGRGGWVYQALAVGITYASIASTYVPDVFKALDRPPDEGALITAFALVLAFAYSLAVPFLGGLQSVLGLVIIGIALWQAWTMNKKMPLEITGPHRVGHG